jgi:hypothetical protein
MDWLPPIEVSRISDGGKVIPTALPHSVILLIEYKCLTLFLKSQYINGFQLLGLLTLPLRFRLNADKASHLHSLSWRKEARPQPISRLSFDSAFSYRPFTSLRLRLLRYAPARFDKPPSGLASHSGFLSVLSVLRSEGAYSGAVLRSEGGRAPNALLEPPFHFGLHRPSSLTSAPTL